MKSLVVFLAVFMAVVSSSSVLGQFGLSNDADTIHVDPSAILYVEGDVTNQASGEINNYGTIHVSGDWTNNAPNDAFFQTSAGVVRMFGATQTIDGLSPTKFYNLILDGGSSTKDMLIDAEVKNQLDLMDAELQTNDNVMFVSNPNVDSVVWNTGFVSSNTLGGYLARSTNSTGTYMYPVGSYSLSNIYRAVEVAPQTGDSNVFAVRVAAVDATYDYTGMSRSGATGGFDRTVKTALLGDINDQFYHNIARFYGTTAANIGVNYFSSDGDYETVAQWQDGTNAWSRTPFFNNSYFGAANIGSPDMLASVSLCSDFNHDLFALSNVHGVLVPQFISPNGDGKNDVLIIENINFYPDNELSVFNRYGTLVYKKKTYDDTWGGLVSGQDNPVFNYVNGSLPSGTYFYVLDLGVGDLPPYTGYIQIQK